ncbi:MAG: type I secretion system permease/ATPase [Alphaproteobacteria bacterium]
MPADVSQIRHAHGGSEPFAEADILLAARRLGLKARAVKSRWDKLAGTALPAIGVARDGSFFVLAKVAEDKVLVLKAPFRQPVTWMREDFEEQWSGRLILLASRASLAGDERRFDVSWFIPAVIKYRRLFYEVIFASFMLQLFGLMSPLFSQVVIDKVLVHRGLSSLDVLVFALVVVSVFEVVLGALRTYIFSHTTNRIDVELGAALFRHLTNLPIAYFGARRVGETVARVRELENIRTFLTGSALTLLVDLVFTVVFFAVMFYYAPILTWVVIASIPFYVVLSVGVTPILRRRVEDKFKRAAENQAFLTETVSGIETLKALAVEPRMQRRFEEQLAGYVGSAFSALSLSNNAGQGIQLIQKISTAVTLWFGARLVIEGHLTVGQLVAFNMLAGRVSQPILRLAQLWQDFQQARISIARLGDILNTKTEAASGSARAALPVLKGEVALDAVTFRYRPDGPETLKKVTLTVPAGQVVGIVGPSGSGKSTLTKLIQRLYIPESGRVLVDGVDLAMVDPAWLRRQIGVVLQENWLFNRSIRDNIALAEPTLGLDRVTEAAKTAGAHDFILELPEGYDTIVGERGGTLSGGQRQRIAIARALVTNPRILIFDEATSALDYESEQAIQRNMREICTGRSVFIIAHRLSTVRDANRIVVLDKGEVVEDGSHGELLQSGGRYARLWQCQTGAPEPEPHADAEISRLPDGRMVVRRAVPLRMG